MTIGEQAARVAFTGAGFKADTGPLAVITLTKHALAQIIDSAIEMHKLASANDAAVKPSPS
jgi:hypothetical protein